MIPNTMFKLLRHELNLSQIEFANKIGVSQGTIADIERGRIKVSRNVKTKIIEKLQNEIGYFDIFDIGKIVDTKQGTEIGLKQGIDTDLDQVRSSAERRIKDLLLPVNKRKQFEKQKVIAEKIFKELYETSSKYKLFKQSVIKIQNFDNILDNLNFSDNINCVLKFDMAAKKYLELPYNDFKQALITDFETFKPYVPVFKDLALAIETFVRRLKEMPTEITGIDQEEMNQYEALVS